MISESSVVKLKGRSNNLVHLGWQNWIVTACFYILSITENENKFVNMIIVKFWLPQGSWYESLELVDKEGDEFEAQGQSLKV
jgi:hypothetical protein